MTQTGAIPDLRFEAPEIPREPHTDVRGPKNAFYPSAKRGEGGSGNSPNLINADPFRRFKEATLKRGSRVYRKS